jgi:hypothetical protein
MDMQGEFAVGSSVPSDRRSSSAARRIIIWLERLALAGMAGLVAAVILVYKVAILDFQEAKVDFTKEAQVFQGAQGEMIAHIERLSATTIVLHLDNGKQFWVASHRHEPVVVGEWTEQ